MAKVIFKWQQKQFSFSSLVATSAMAQLAGCGDEVIHASYSDAACPVVLEENFGLAVLMFCLLHLKP